MVSMQPAKAYDGNQQAAFIDELGIGDGLVRHGAILGDECENIPACRIDRPRMREER
jgi:hypothetical protein